MTKNEARSKLYNADADRLAWIFGSGRMQTVERLTSFYAQKLEQADESTFEKCRTLNQVIKVLRA